MVFQLYTLFLLLSSYSCSFIPQISSQTIKGAGLVSKNYPKLRTILLITVNNELLLNSFYSLKNPSIKDGPKAGFWYDVLRLATWKALSSNSILDLDKLIEDSDSSLFLQYHEIVDSNTFPSPFKELLNSLNSHIRVIYFDEAGAKVSESSDPLLFDHLDILNKLQSYPHSSKLKREPGPLTFTVTKRIENSVPLLRIEIKPSDGCLKVPQTFELDGKKYVLMMINDNIIRSAHDGAFYSLGTEPHFIHFETAVYQGHLKSLIYIVDPDSCLKINDPFVLNFVRDPRFTFKNVLFVALSLLFGCLAASSFAINVLFNKP